MWPNEEHRETEASDKTSVPSTLLGAHVRQNTLRMEHPMVVCSLVLPEDLMREF